MFVPSLCQGNKMAASKFKRCLLMFYYYCLFLTAVSLTAHAQWRLLVYLQVPGLLLQVQVSELGILNQQTTNCQPASRGLLLSSRLYALMFFATGIFWSLLGSMRLWSVLVCPGLYLGAIEEQQHVVHRPPLFCQLFPQGVDGGASRGGAGVGVKGRGAGESMDGAVGQEARRSRFLQQRTLGERAPQN